MRATAVTLIAVLPDGYSLRRPRRDEAEAVAALISDFDVAMWGWPDCTPDDVISEWDAMTGDLDRNAWVVDAPGGGLAAYATATENIPGKELWGDGFVHPAHTGHGLGTLIVDLMHERFAEFAVPHPGVALTAFNVIAGPDKPACQLLCDRGYEISRRDWFMVIDVAPDLQSPPPPAGIQIDAFDWDRDAHDAHRVLTESFSEHRNSAPKPFEEWAKMMQSHPSYDPTLWRIAREDGRVVGASANLNLDRHGMVRTLGVLASHRGRGIGEALLRTSFAVFAARGQMRIALGVDSQNRTGATRLYERAGMSINREFVFHSITLPPPA